MKNSLGRVSIRLFFPEQYREKETRGARLIYVGNLIYMKLESNRGG